MKKFYSVRLTQRSTMRARLQFRGVVLKGCNVLKRVFKRVFWIKIKCVFRIKTADTRGTRDVVDL